LISSFAFCLTRRKDATSIGSPIVIGRSREPLSDGAEGKLMPVRKDQQGKGRRKSRSAKELLPPHTVNMPRVACAQHHIVRGTCHIRESQA
jgi:hypothetical protein